ncbi:hypothetical protein CA265_04995 [Sphingobacteriaceae bacterium GW460-11-11-14-LB5]|nr:hypothetical protein CA265_04995 [Sphingobacteriaceae bacterium GW460-11-11-14-LB5]
MLPEDSVQILIFPLYAAGAWYFGAPKYPKRFVNPAMWHLTTHTHQKNSGTLFCSFLLSESLKIIFTKPLRFRFGSAICALLQLFFRFFGHLGLTASFCKMCALLKLLSKMPRLFLNIFVHTVGFHIWIRGYLVE